MSRYVTYIPAAGGSAVVLSSPRRAEGVRLHRGAEGLEVPPVEAVSAATPGADGELFVGARYGVRRVKLRGQLSAATRAGFRARFAELQRAIAVHAGPGELDVNEGGASRRLRCLYVDGLAGDEARDAHGLRWWRFVLEFEAFDPFWYDARYWSQSWTSPVPVPFFTSDETVFALSNDATLGATTATNDGDIEAWPEWTVRGPCDYFQATNSTTGESFKINGPLAANRTLTVTTQPSQDDIVASAPAENWWSRLEPGGDLWALQPGVNDITLAAPGSTATTRITTRYRRRWRTAT